MNDSFSIHRQYRGFWLFRERIIELRAKAPSLEPSSGAGSPSSSPSTVGANASMLRALAERLCGVLSDQLPFLQEPASKLNGVLLKNLRALDKADCVDAQVLFDLSGELAEPLNASCKESDMEGDALAGTPQSIPVTFKVITNFHSYERQTVVHSVLPLLSPSLKEHSENIFPLMILRNPGFKFGSMSVGYERYQYKSKIAHWCNLPTVDYRLELVLSPARRDALGSEADNIVLLRGSFSRDADPKFFREMEILMFTISDFFNLGSEMHGRIREILS